MRDYLPFGKLAVARKTREEDGRSDELFLLLKRKIIERFSGTNFQFDKFRLWGFFLENTIDFSSVEQAIRTNAGMKDTGKFLRCVRRFVRWQIWRRARRLIVAFRSTDLPSRILQIYVHSNRMHDVRRSYSLRLWIDDRWRIPEENRHLWT